ncbi:MAG: hypothetical protein LBM96_10425 [Methanobrevibacter sp.]|jgi:hypothetical protein|nr:hypothetical protein [Candidatus Methanoflexus mossambicus]
MKVVVCENCGAKYQIEDLESPDYFECTTCAGNIKDESSENAENVTLSSFSHVSSHKDVDLVKCDNCGLKYLLDKNKDIKQYQCSGCDGNLKYVDSKLNRERNVIYQEDIIDHQDIQYTKSNSEAISDIISYSDTISNNDLTDNFEKDIKHYEDNDFEDNDFDNIDYGSLDNDLNNDVDGSLDNGLNKDLDDNLGNTLDNSLDDNFDNVLDSIDNEKELRGYIKNQFSKDLNNAYGINEKSNFFRDLNTKNTKNFNYNNSNNFNNFNNSNNDSNNFNNSNNNFKELKNQIDNLDNKISINDEENSFNAIENIDNFDNFNNENNEDIKENIDNSKRINIESNNIKNSRNYFHDFLIIFGLIIALIGFLDILLTLRHYSIIILLIGIIIFYCGIHLNKKQDKNNFRGHVVREMLLNLSDEFHILFHVKVPKNNGIINHVVVGPTGIFTILTQNYSKDSKKDIKGINMGNNISNEFSSINFENKNNDINNKNINNNNDINNNINTLKDEKQTKFAFNNLGEIKFDSNSKIKFKAIKSTENLVNFLNDNGLNIFSANPFVAFVNKNIILFNYPLNDQDLFKNELLSMISNGEVILTKDKINKIVILLSQYSLDSVT